LAAAATLAYQWRARRAAEDALRSESSPAARPGPDAAPGATPVRLRADERGVSRIPTVKMIPAGSSARRKSAAPPAPGR
ncbi:MAG: hypothetical protein HY079_05970, partial [Elusimicrobia bacterium]|nr:hypothetical protein [Elusimicrobiota bacterium]